MLPAAGRGHGLSPAEAHSGVRAAQPTAMPNIASRMQFILVQFILVFNRWE
jgi:hypothetical protein